MNPESLEMNSYGIDELESILDELTILLVELKPLIDQLVQHQKIPIIPAPFMPSQLSNSHNKCYTGTNSKQGGYTYEILS